MILRVSLIQVLTLLVNTLLPLVVGLVTTRLTNSRYQALLLAALSAVTGFVSEWIHALNANITYNLSTAIFTWITGFVVAVAVHYGLWVPTGTTNAVLRSGFKPKHEAK